MRCWNIVVKVVPPGEPCPWCGSCEPHDSCPEKQRALEVAAAKAAGLPVPPVQQPCKQEGECDRERNKYNIFQFER
ncbi:Protein of unknown function [Gryllus bimaculatus]|nr:Protein of unknown function [Gryllus bimaculatus]